MPDSTAYLVSGFGQGFDMRPTNFQSAVPEFWVCSLCRVICSTVVSLSCLHSVCEPCYAQCIGVDRLCPLDQTPIEEDEKRVPFSPRQLSVLKVACWNAPNSCAFSGSCSDVLHHFEHDCEFHVISCPNCQARVLRKDVVKHLKSACSARIAQCVDTESPLSPFQSAQRAQLEIKQLLKKNRDDHLHLQTSFNELSERVQSASARLRESSEAGVTRFVDLVRDISAALRDDLAAGFAGCKTHVDREISELKRTLTLATPRVPLCTAGLAHVPQKQSWVLEGWRNLITRASKGTVETERPLLCVLGYSVSLLIKMTGGSPASMLIGFMIHPGPLDDYLDWPFKGAITVCVVHPKDKTKTKKLRLDPAELLGLECFQRPLGRPTNPYSLGFLSPSSLEEDGFIENDKLHFAIEVTEPSHK